MGKINDVEKIIWRMKNDSGKTEQDISTILSSISNPNLLMNGEFRVNQRGGSGVISTLGYTIADRWKLVAGDYKKVDNGILLNNGSEISQAVENFDYKGVPITASVCLSSGIVSGTNTINYTAGTAKTINFISTTSFSLDCLYDGSNVRFVLKSNADNLTIKYVKVELGNIATQYHFKNYAEELSACQRYYLKVSGGRYAGVAFGTKGWFFFPTPTKMHKLNSITMQSAGRIHNMTQIAIPTEITGHTLLYNGVDVYVNHSKNYATGNDVATWEDVTLIFDGEI